MNDIKLQEGHPVDSNLRPLKVGNSSTSLELADTGNGARIRGNLEVTGEIISNIKADHHLSSIISTDFTIDDSGDITLDSDGGEIYLKDGGSTFGEFSTASAKSTLRLYESAGGTDYVSFYCAANGATFISTNDSAGSDANITITADGDLIHSSFTGNFIIKKGATEFSVANSAYAGMILGYTTVGIDAAPAFYTLTTSFVVTNSSHSVSFIAPPSGVVEIFISIYCDFTRRNVELGLSDNSTYNTIDATHEHIVALPPSAAGDRQINHRWVITGLTSGTAYKYYLGAKSTHNLANILRWGGDSTGEYAPFIMKATALPTAVTAYAVYG